MPEPEAGVRATLRRKGFLPVAEVAKRLGVTVQTVYNMLEDGRIEGARTGNRGQWVKWASVKAHYRRADPQVAKLLGEL